jgi:hypothetical protein
MTPQEQAFQQFTGEQALPPIGPGMPMQAPQGGMPPAAVPPQQMHGATKIAMDNTMDLLAGQQPAQQPATGPGPMGAAVMQARQTTVGTPPAAAAAAAPAYNGNVAPPSHRVTFEVKGNPFRQDAFFHDVIRQDHLLILVFDNRATGFPRVFPQTVEEDMAVAVEGMGVIYVTKVPGIQYTFREWEHCIVFIKEEYPMNAG